MHKIRFLIVLGIVVALLPFSGFPQGFKNFLFVFLGLLVATLSYLTLRARALYKSRRNDNLEANFVINPPTAEDQKKVDGIK